MKKLTLNVGQPGPSFATINCFNVSYCYICSFWFTNLVRSKMKKSLLIVLLVLFLVASCAKYVHTPIIDSRGSHLKGADLKRFHDDLFTCQEIAANQDVNKKKTRIFTERCMEGRSYVILDKDM